MPTQKVLKLYKNVGETPLACLERFRQANPLYEEVPMTYAGRLDPMAEGLLLVLAGDECKRKEDYLKLPKVYEGEVLFGFETDTGDILGMPNASGNFAQLTTDNLRLTTNQLVGKRTQKYPVFSSKTVKGKPLWKWAREGGKIELPEREIEVVSFEVTGCRTESYSSILQKTKIAIGDIKGDFRQDHILEGWKKVLGGEKRRDKEATICSFRTKVSSGTYIRVLAEELGERLDIKATLFSLKRTRVGNFSL